MDRVNFCPTCGEDLRALVTGGAPGEPAAASAVGAVLRREVTSQEVEDVWGNQPLPFKILPFGVVLDAAGAVVAIAGEDGSGDKWALKAGETKLLGDVGIPDLTNALEQHVCRPDTGRSRAGRGADRYGSDR